MKGQTDGGPDLDYADAVTRIDMITTQKPKMSINPDTKEMVRKNPNRLHNYFVKPPYIPMT